MDAKAILKDGQWARIENMLVCRPAQSGIPGMKLHH
jgi:hypothetical protein